MNETSIAWATHSWNPISGCSKISEGCRNCYAERISLKFRHTALPWTAANAGENVRLHPDRLAQVDKLKPGQRIFVNSMSDLFHPAVPHDFILQVWAKMVAHPEHVFIVLTKRAEAMRDWPFRWPVHIWGGVTIEDSRNLPRLTVLKESMVTTKLVSFEPLLGPVNADLTGIDWVIVGGESGPGYRPMEAAWVRTLRDAAKTAGAAFFFKQFPGLTPGHTPQLDGVEYHEFPLQKVAA